MSNKINIEVRSEIGELRSVILHTPGPEVENMTPANAERALYSDILNLAVAKKEYAQFKSILDKLTQTYSVEDLLREVLQDEQAKDRLLRKICANECVQNMVDDLMQLEADVLAQQLIQGVPMKKNSLTNFLSGENYSLRPLHNFFFARDAAVSIYDKVLISKMANPVRERESIIMEAIFEYHPSFLVPNMNPLNYPNSDPEIRIEGGDVLIARHDILLAGIGARTSPQGIDFLLNRLKEKKGIQHIIVQELPSRPESFIHLDMVFTLLDKNTCMVYEPLILKPNRYATVHIRIDHGEVNSIDTVKNIPEVLNKLGMDLEMVYCGGRKDPMLQEREQWHSGANFFAIAPGIVMGYGRNVHTLDDMNNKGFEIIRGKDILSKKVNIEDYNRCLIALDGSELARGGGGIRCMTMPLNRKNIDW